MMKKLNTTTILSAICISAAVDPLETNLISKKASLRFFKTSLICEENKLDLKRKQACFKTRQAGLKQKQA